MKAPRTWPFLLAALAACTSSSYTWYPKPEEQDPRAVNAAAKLPLAPSDGGGMWTFDNPPSEWLQRKFHFTPTKEWLEHVRLASVRFPGGSGSFVSPNGLVLTNHHVALDSVQKLSDATHDYVADGFYAKTRAEEYKCQDLELNVLMSTENVTARVKGAMKPGAAAKENEDLRKKESKAIEKESKEKTGLLSNVVAFYAGEEFWLYRYKRYTDVRLVFAPEQTIAFYGGDPDNFTYPRYDLDFALFRAYENDQPVQSKHYLPFNAAGAKENELVFVSGHPGTTNRLKTVAQLEYMRDQQFPRTLKSLRATREALVAYGLKGPEESRQAKEDLFGLENSIKAYIGYLDGLENPRVMARKQAEEKELRDKVAADPKLAAQVGPAWDQIAATQRTLSGFAKRASFTNLRGTLAGMALRIVQHAEEADKPDSERLLEYTDARLETMKRMILSDAPIYPGLDEAQLASGLEMSRSELGADDVFVKEILGKKSPQEVAASLIRGTKLTDPAVRKALFDGGKKAVADSTDPMIVAARTIDPWVRSLRKQREDEVDAVDREAGAKIARARFEVYGHTAYPDATFTLRLSPGVVKGYEQGTTQVPYKTTIYGLYDRSASFNDQEPFKLPKRYVDRRAKIDLATPFDFVTTCDIIGGNSGSPVINAKGDLVGLIFDGNIQSLAGNFVYDDVEQRAVSVHSAAILETLRNVYEADDVLKELVPAGN